ncbi:MAG: hypothetical protein ACK5IB_13100 [Qingshengfaniella sp.]
MAAQLQEDRDAMQLAALQAEIAELQRQIAALSGMPTGDLTTSGFAQSGGLERWDQHRISERTRLNGLLAKKMAVLPETKRTAGLSAARRMVLEQLQKNT